MDRFFGGRWAVLVTVLFIAITIPLAYSNTFHSEFQFDDETVIIKNPGIRDLKNIPALLRGIRGVTTTSFALNYAVGGFNVTGWHIVNTAIHVFAAIVAYLVLLNTFRLAGASEVWSRRTAAFSALIFALHPVQTEAVTYIVQRMESLAGLFYLLALFAFIKAAEAAQTTKRILFCFLVGLFYILGFYSKEVAITLPLIILLYDLFFLSPNRLRGVLSRWPLYGVLAVLTVFFALTTVIPLGGFNDLSKESTIVESGVQGAASPEVSNRSPQGPSAQKGAEVKISPEGIPPVPLLKKTPTAGFGVLTITPWKYFLTQSNVMLYYYSLLILPVNQNHDYDFPVSGGLFEVPRVRPGAVLNIPLPPPAVSIFIHLAILALALYLFLRSRGAGSPRSLLIAFFIFWFYIILAPTSTIVPIIDVIFEHRLYLAMLGCSSIFVISVDALIGWVARKRGMAEDRPVTASTRPSK